MITGFAHVCFSVRNLDASLDFYCDKLGLRHAFDFTGEDGKRFGVYLHAGGRNFIELFIGDVTERASKQSFGHICLEVDDIRETVTDLRAEGLTVGEITLGCDNSWQAWLSDPDGNAIELHEYTPESWQLDALRRLGNDAS